MDMSEQNDYVWTGFFSPGFFSRRRPLPSRSKSAFRMQAQNGLHKLVRQEGRIEPERVNDFLKRYGNGLDLEDKQMRALLRKAGVQVERDGKQWVVRASTVDKRAAR